MHSKNCSTNHITTLIKYIVLLCIFAILGSTAACNMPFKIVPNTQEEGPPPGEEDSPPGDGPFGEEIRIEFLADRTDLQPGECTMLFWNTEGGFGAFLNEEPVERSGEREVCLGDESMAFVLGVDTGEGMETREIEIVVGGMPGEEPPPEPNPGEPPPPEPEPPQPQPEQAPPQVNPPTPVPQAPANQCQSNFETDIAITDLYAGNLPNGQVHMRITNHGPCTLQNVKDEVYCFVDLTNHSTNKVTYDSATVKVVYNMAPGTQQTFPTGITLDTNVFKYKVTCNLQPGNFKEINSSNNSHTEQIP